jgi:hypothetical protein
LRTSLQEEISNVKETISKGVGKKEPAIQHRPTLTFKQETMPVDPQVKIKEMIKSLTKNGIEVNDPDDASMEQLKPDPDTADLYHMRIRSKPIDYCDEKDNDGVHSAQQLLKSGKVDATLNEMVQTTTGQTALFKCNVCPYNSKRKDGLTKHVNVVHEKIKNYVCQSCQKPFGQKSHLQHHSISIHGKKLIKNE